MKSNAGRKKSDDKAVQVCIYPKQSRLEKLGKEKIQEIAMIAVEKEFKKIKKI